MRRETIVRRGLGSKGQGGTQLTVIKQAGEARARMVCIYLYCI